MQLKQAEHLRKAVPGESKRLASGEGCKGEAPPYLRKFLMS